MIAPDRHGRRPRAWAPLLLVAACVAAHAAEESAARATGGAYAVRWSTLDAGGGRSAGGVYAVTASIGQAHAAAALTGTSPQGSVRLRAGFWPTPPVSPAGDAVFGDGFE
jgi:hypothetical protein